MREADLCRAIMRALEREGACVIKTTGVNRGGTPDLLGCYQGHAFALEVKLPGGSATLLQRRQIARWQDAGARAGVVRGVKEALRIALDTGE